MINSPQLFVVVSCLRCRIHTKFGHNYLALMRYADATKHYEAALQIQLKKAETDIEGRPRNMEIVQLLINLGHVHYDVRIFCCIILSRVLIFSSIVTIAGTLSFLLMF